MKFYSLDKILDEHATYNMVIGERSNGKTYAVLKYALEKYQRQGSKLAIVRRWQDDFKKGRAKTIFNGLTHNGVISEITNGEYDRVVYQAGEWYFARVDDKGELVKHTDCFAYAFALTSWEHDKMTSYPDVDTILFDEFLTRSRYLPDEFIIWNNVVSTIVRYRANVEIFMLGNTVNIYSPYFEEYGIFNIGELEPGSINIYKFGEDGETKLALEYADSPSDKPSDIYYAFNNPKLKMITTGAWEMALYPHCPCSYNPSDIVFTYFIQFYNNTLQCEVIQVDDLCFTYIHRKTTPIKNNDTDLIYTPEFSPRPNYRRKLNKPFTEGERLIWDFFVRDKVFYQSNQIGEVVRNYLDWCQTDKFR